MTKYPAMFSEEESMRFYLGCHLDWFKRYLKTSKVYLLVCLGGLSWHALGDKSHPQPLLLWFYPCLFVSGYQAVMRIPLAQ